MRALRIAITISILLLAILWLQAFTTQLDLPESPIVRATLTSAAGEFHAQLTAMAETPGPGDVSR